MKARCALILFCCLLQAALGYAQSEAWQDARSLFARYDGHQSLSFRAAIKMYPVARPQEIIDQQQAVYSLEQQEYYCRIGTMELMRNKKYWLTIDHADKTMLVAGTHTKQREAPAAFDLSGLLERLQEDKVTLTVSKRGNLRVLEITGMPDPRKVKYEFVYDPQTFLIRQMVMEMDQGDGANGQGRMKMQMDYYQYATSKTNPEIFSEKKYVLINGKQAVLQSAYASYQLINQL